MGRVSGAAAGHKPTTIPREQGEGARDVAAETPVEDAQSAAGESAEPAAVAYAPKLDDDGRPVQTFPRIVRIHGRFEGHDGQLGSVMFAAGVSKIMHVTACTGAVEDLATGLTLVPQYENREFVVDPATRFWNRLQPVDPDHAEKLQAMIRQRLGTPAPVDPEAEMRAFLERVVTAIGVLEKGNPRDWLNDGRPDVTQLSAPLGVTVSPSVRDAAWAIAKECEETAESVLWSLKEPGRHGGSASRWHLCPVDEEWRFMRTGRKSLSVISCILASPERCGG